MSSQFRKNTAITHIFTEPPSTYIIVLSPPDSNLPDQARSVSHRACSIRKLSKRTMLQHCLKINLPSSHVREPHKCRQLLPYSSLRSIPVHYAPHSLSRRQCLKCRHQLFATIKSGWLCPPRPFKAGGGNLDTSSRHFLASHMRKTRLIAAVVTRVEIDVLAMHPMQWVNNHSGYKFSTKGSRSHAFVLLGTSIP